MTAPEPEVCFDCGIEEGNDEHKLHQCRVCFHLICEGDASDHALQECGWSKLIED